MLPASRAAFVFFLILVPAAHAASVPERAAGLDPATFWSMIGPVPHDGLGFSVASAGDVNRDGFSDILVSAQASTAGNSAVYLLYGSPGGPVTPPAWKKENYTGGVRVSAAGDLNGDGYDDVIFGSGEIPASPGGGWIEVRYGSASGLSNTPDFAVTYPFSSGGYVVGAAGDVNGDGYDDALVGDPTYSGCGYNEGGRLSVYYGGASGLNGTVWFWCGYPAHDNSRVGETFAGVGDINGDGYDDLVSNIRNLSGWNQIIQFFGASVGLGDWAGVFDTNVSNSSSEFGHLLAPAGDVNGDGYADILVGDPHYGAAASDSGVVSVVAGGPNGIPGHSPNGSIIAFAILGGPKAGSQFGTAGFTAGDINGDGLADIVIGAPTFSSSPTEQLEGVFVPYLSNGSTVTAQPAVEGNVPGMWLGASICAAGDVNGDGFGDVIVGAPQANVGLGQVRVYYGAAEKPAATAITRFGGQSNEIAGWSVAVGDVNGDGYEDVLMGAPNGDVGVADTGLISLYLGVQGGIATTPVWTAGGATGSSLGISSAMGLDINGDGYGDIIAGAHVDGGVGSLNVWYGRASWAGSSTAPSIHLMGNESGAYFGASVAFAGDVNADGYADVLVASPYHDSGPFTDSGTAYLYLGGPGGLFISPSWSSSGSQVDEHRGSVASAGDVNGDGYSDVVVGADGYDDGANADAGRALVYLGGFNGLSNTPQIEWKGENAGVLFGHTVAGVGDMDGDGWGDVAVGAHSFGGTGKVYVFRGSSGGSEATAAWSQAGSQGGGAFGSTVSPAGDVNGDGRSDLLVGAVFEDGPGGPDCGKGYVYTGPLPASLYATFAGPSFLANMGHAIAAGDVNADGFGDLVFGEPRLAQSQFDEGGFQLYLANLGRGRGRPTAPSRAGFGGIPVGLYGTSGSTSQIDINVNALSAGGRDRVASEWRIDPIAAGASSHFWSPFVPMGAPTDPGKGVVTIGSAAFGLTANTPYAWRVRTQSRSPWFRYGMWISPQGNARNQWDIRTLPGPNAVDEPGSRSAAGLRAWPNPSTSAVQIEFDLARTSDVLLTVTDVNGRQVRRFAKDRPGAGVHRWAWDGRDDRGLPCPPGLYFAVLQSDGGRSARRITLLR